MSLRSHSTRPCPSFRRSLLSSELDLERPQTPSHSRTPSHVCHTRLSEPRLPDRPLTEPHRTPGPSPVCYQRSDTLSTVGGTGRRVNSDRISTKGKSQGWAELRLEEKTQSLRGGHIKKTNGPEIGPERIGDRCAKKFNNRKNDCQF